MFQYTARYGVVAHCQQLISYSNIYMHIYGMYSGIRACCMLCMPSADRYAFVYFISTKWRFVCRCFLSIRQFVHSTAYELLTADAFLLRMQFASIRYSIKTNAYMHTFVCFVEFAGGFFFITYSCVCMPTSKQQLFVRVCFGRG